MSKRVEVCALISAGAEWRALLPHFPLADLHSSPYGDWFLTEINEQSVCFLHGGWGKVAAAGSTQYAIDRWQPERILNLGTCGGFTGQVERGAVVLAKKTIIYDIIEQMSDQDRAIAHYSVDHDLSWLPDTSPQPVVRGTLVSADRDILPQDIPMLIQKYQAVVADWESGAIAWVAQQNKLPCLILRGVTDLVDANSGEAHGNYTFFEKQTKEIMACLIENLPAWLEVFRFSK